MICMVHPSSPTTWLLVRVVTGSQQTILAGSEIEDKR